MFDVDPAFRAACITQERTDQQAAHAAGFARLQGVAIDKGWHLYRTKVGYVLRKGTHSKHYGDLVDAVHAVRRLATGPKI